MKRLFAALVVVLGLSSLGLAGEDAPEPRRGGRPAEPAGMEEPQAPAPDSDAKAPPKDWSAHMGALKFIVGYDDGLDEAWRTGRPAMLFFSSIKNHWCPGFGKRMWSNTEITDKLMGYLPVLVDADVDTDAVKRYGVGTLPTVVWVTFEGEILFKTEGDSTVDEFDEQADVAKSKTPPVRPPEKEIAYFTRIREDLKKATEGSNVRKMLDAATALSTLKRPKAAAVEGAKIVADLEAKGTARLVAATKWQAEGRLAEARAEFEKLAAEYRGRSAGRVAAESLREIDAAMDGK